VKKLSKSVKTLTNPIKMSQIIRLRENCAEKQPVKNAFLRPFCESDKFWLSFLAETDKKELADHLNDDQSALFPAGKAAVE
jgi:hypothetical protein